jgi:hypothetical protein
MVPQIFGKVVVTKLGQNGIGNLVEAVVTSMQKNGI